jgi:MFS family permease
MLLALSLFGAGTICCGLAPSMELLILARAVAGMGGGGCVMFPQLS